jgi:hypothetical protein
MPGDLALCDCSIYDNWRFCCAARFEPLKKIVR